MYKKLDIFIDLIFNYTNGVFNKLRDSALNCNKFCQLFLTYFSSNYMLVPNENEHFNPFYSDAAAAASKYI